MPNEVPVLPSVAVRGLRRTRWITASLAAFGTLVPFGCVYDANNRCSANEVYKESAKLCVCVEGAVLTDQGCQLCGEHEVVSGGKCVCAIGYYQPASSAACQTLPPALGAACSTATPCSDATYSFCHVTGTGGAGYCTTSACSSSADCIGGYACDTTATPSYCKRPPTGLGAACKTATDCANTEATYCETFQSHTCMVQGCSLSSNDCFEGYACCDVTAYVGTTLCVPTGTCPK